MDAFVRVLPCIELAKAADDHAPPDLVDLRNNLAAGVGLMSEPPGNDLSRAIASLRGAVEGLSADKLEAQPARPPEIQQSTSEAYPDAASAPPVSVEPPKAPQAPITTSAYAGERRDKTAAGEGLAPQSGQILQMRIEHFTLA
jgi:hypothetical protein